MLWYNHRTKPHGLCIALQHCSTNLGETSDASHTSRKPPGLNYHIVFTLCQTLHQPYTLSTALPSESSCWFLSSFILGQAHTADLPADPIPEAPQQSKHPKRNPGTPMKSYNNSANGGWGGGGVWNGKTFRRYGNVSPYPVV